jgi:molybdopterin molybdotransferase
MSELISYEEASRLLISHIPPQRRTTVSLSQALGRVLCCDIEANQDVPAFDKSVMDGYAVRSGDMMSAANTARVVGEVLAGELPDFSLGLNEAASIMTGAPLPSGADAVVMVEKAERLDNSKVILYASAQSGENVAFRASEVACGDVVLNRGQLIEAAQIGVLAMFGKTEVEVTESPQIGILPTGSEIVEVSENPGIGQIRNSNAPMLTAQSQQLGLMPIVYPVITDDIDTTRSALEAGLEQVDLLVLTGGVSMGKHDYVPQVLQSMGVDLIFHKVAIKPGKPILFGRRGERLVFGLPGNPVSSFVTFELFVRPAIRHWMGHKSPFHVEVEACLERAVCNEGDRDFFAPGKAAFAQDGIAIDPVETKGSADLVAFSRANSLIHLGACCGELAAGTLVKILLLRQPGPQEEG